jgi:PAS domain S-box-containing protein
MRSANIETTLSIDRNTGTSSFRRGKHECSVRKLFDTTLFKRTIEALLVAALYFVLGLFSLQLVSKDTSAPLVWLPMGMALAAVLLRGYRVWPGIALGAFAFNLASLVGMALPARAAIGITIAISFSSVIAALIGARLLQLLHAQDIRHSARAILQFAGVACVIPAAISASIGATTAYLYVMGREREIAVLWLTWWIGDALGALVVTPLLLTLVNIQWRRLSLRALGAGILITGLLALFTAYAFGPNAPTLLAAGSGLHYLIIIAVLWVAFRFRWAGAAAAVAVVVGVTGWQTARGFGPLIGASPDATLIVHGVYLATLTIAAWAMASGVSQQRQTMHEISRLSQFNQSIIDNASVWINVTDLQGNILVWNKAAETMSGYSHEEVVGHDGIWTWLYPDQAMEKNLRQLAQSTAHGDEGVADFETAIRCRNGASKVISWYECGLKDEEGRTNGSVALGRDITDQKRAEEALRQSVANFTALAENASDAIFITALPLPGQFVYANKSAAALTGYTVNELQQLNLRHLIHPDHLDLVCSQFNARIESQSPRARYEIQIVCRDGSFVPVEVTSAPTTWHDQPATITTLRDISDRKRAEQALRESEERYRLVTEAASEIILLHDMTGRISYINRAASEISGYSVEELLQRSIFDVLPEDVIPAARERLLLREQRVDEVLLYETTFLNAQRQRVPLEISSSLVRPEGKPAQVLIIARDIRERQRMQAEQYQLRAQLLEAQKMEAVGQLAGGIAHDFNNLLTAVNGYAELIQVHSQESDTRDMAARIEHAGQRAAELVRQLLAYASKQMIQPQIVDLNVIVQRSIENVSDGEVDGIQRHMDLAPDLWPLFFDLNQTHQILNGLLTHTYDAMPDGGEITIRTANVTQGAQDLPPLPGFRHEDYVLLEITHSGPPMEESIRQRIFEPFFFTSDAVGDGVGLRMAAVYGIVKQNQGHIIVDSPHEDGTRYRILLPRPL